MKGAIIVCFLALAAVALARPEGDKYTDRFDSIDIPQILENKNLLKAYIACLLEKGKCTAEGKELKGHIKDAISNDCLKCTEPQRKGTKQVLTHLINHEVEAWNELKAKYDPTGEHSARYEKELKEIKA